MKALVIYDSSYGNTATIANAIAEALGSDARAIDVDQAQVSDIQPDTLIIVGSPTQGGRPTAQITGFLKAIPQDAIKGAKVAAFDTRMAPEEQGLGLRLVMKVIGYAGPRIAAALNSRGGQLAMPPEGFIVEDKEGPLKPGELERARMWARSLLARESAP